MIVIIALNCHHVMISNNETQSGCQSVGQPATTFTFIQPDSTDYSRIDNCGWPCGRQNVPKLLVNATAHLLQFGRTDNEWLKVSNKIPPSSVIQYILTPPPVNRFTFCGQAHLFVELSRFAAVHLISKGANWNANIHRPLDYRPIWERVFSILNSNLVSTAFPLAAPRAAAAAALKWKWQLLVDKQQIGYWTTKSVERNFHSGYYLIWKIFPKTRVIVKINIWLGGKNSIYLIHGSFWAVSHSLQWYHLATQYNWC